jgi:hypothetical protein
MKTPRTLIRDEVTNEEMESKIRIIRSKFLTDLWEQVKYECAPEDWVDALDEALTEATNK